MSGGTRVSVNQQTMIHCSMDKAILVITWGQAFAYIRESYQQL
jgi:hypothetical protein